jgi:hypothetical protein
MRQRWVRFFPNVDLHVGFRNDQSMRSISESLRTHAIPDPSPEFTWWDWTVFLLQTAAEVEHSLMVQYLYAAYSIEESIFRGSIMPETVKAWHDNLLMISKQEMAHLATVQNLLRFIGGYLNFEREDFPFRSYLYPFKFALEPLSKKSLAKYVCAEMPEDPGNHDLMSQIMKIATETGEGTPTNRVGELYAKLISIFEDQKKLPDSHFRYHTVETLQASYDDWARNDDNRCLLVKKISSRAEAIEALKSISEQGEGLGKPQKDQSCPESHFEIFLTMYKEYLDMESKTANFDWLPIRRVPINPNTIPELCSDPEIERSRITSSLSLLHAHLFNVRYRKLIAYLSHAFTIEEVEKGDAGEKSSIRELTSNEMYFLSAIATTLIKLPLKNNNVNEEGYSELVAAPPFELPPSLAFPDRREDQWQLHSSLIGCSIELIRKIRLKSGEADAFKFMVKTEKTHYKKLGSLFPDSDIIAHIIEKLEQFQPDQ